MNGRYITDGGSDRGQSERPDRFTYDIDRDELPSEAVVRAVAAVTNTSPLVLDPLYHVIDPDNLDEVLQRRGRHGGGTELTFTFEGCEVTVTSERVRTVLVETDD